MEWTSIEKRLPPIGIPLIVTVYDHIRMQRELRYPVVYRKSFYQCNYGFFFFGVEEERMLPDVSEVIAWAEIPNPWEGEYNVSDD